MLGPVWVTRIKPAQNSSFSTAGRNFWDTFEIFFGIIWFVIVRYNLRLRQSLDEVVKSLLEEVETLVAWFRRLSLKRRQIAAKQEFWKLFTHTIGGKEKANANCKLQQNKTKNVYLSPFGEKKQIANCSKKNDHIHHSGKRKSILQIAAKNCSITPLGKIKSKLHKIG